MMAGSCVRVTLFMRGMVNCDMPFRGMGMTVPEGSLMLAMANVPGFTGMTVRGLFSRGIAVTRRVGW